MPVNGARRLTNPSPDNQVAAIGWYELFQFYLHTTLDSVLSVVPPTCHFAGYRAPSRFSLLFHLRLCIHIIMHQIRPRHRLTDCVSTVKAAVNNTSNVGFFHRLPFKSYIRFAPLPFFPHQSHPERLTDAHSFSSTTGDRATPVCGRCSNTGRECRRGFKFRPIKGVNLSEWSQLN